MLRFIQRRAGTSVTFQTASFVRISTRTKRRRPLPASVRSIPEEDPTKLWSCHRCHFLSTNSHPEEEGPRENGPKAKTPMQQQHPSVASAYIPPGIEVQVSGVPTDKIGYAQFASVGNNDEDSETRRTPRTEGEAIGEDRKHADNYFASLDHHSSAGTSSTDDDEIWEAANTASDNDDSPTSSSGTASDDEEAPSDGGDPREHPLETLRKRTVAFTNEENTPFGSFTPEMWYESVRLLGHWTRGMELSNTPETVDQSFLLLDRLVFEQELQKYHALSVSLLNTRLLNRIIWNWRRCVKSFHHYSVEDQALLRFEFTPMELLARLEEYSNRSPHLQPNTKTFNMIMDGARCCCVPSNTGVSGMISPRVATNFAQSLFDRMVAADEAQTKSNSDDVQYSHTDAKGGPSIKPNVETYSTLIQLFSHHGLATRAEALLDKMYKNFKETEDPSLTPTVKIFTTVLSGKFGI